MTAPYRAPPSLPAGMTSAIFAEIQRLPDKPTARHPFGLRYAVLERACLLHDQAGLDWAEADERAMAEEAGVPTQRTIGGVA